MKIDATITAEQAEKFLGQIQRMIGEQFSSAVSKKHETQKKAKASLRRIMTMTPRDYMEVGEAAQIFGVSEDRIRREVLTNHLSFLDSKGCIRVMLASRGLEFEVEGVKPSSLPKATLLGLMMAVRTDEGIEILNQLGETVLCGSHRNEQKHW